MKKFIQKNKTIIESTLAIIELLLAFITSNQDTYLVDGIIFLNDFQTNHYQFSNINYVELLTLFVSRSDKKVIILFYHKYLCMMAWFDFTFFLGCTIYTNVIFHNPIFHHTGIIDIAEIVVLIFKKRPVEKFNKIIDLLDSLFNY